MYLQVEVHKGSGILLQQHLEAFGHETNTEQTSVVMHFFLLHHLNTSTNAHAHFFSNFECR